MPFLLCLFLLNFKWKVYPGYAKITREYTFLKEIDMFLNIKPEPDFSRLGKTLLLQGKADRVPLFDFGVHQFIKEKVIGHPVKTAEDEIDFWLSCGYDYVIARLKPLEYKDSESKAQSTSHGNLRSIDKLNNSIFEWTEIYKNTWKLENYNFEFLKDVAKKLPQGMKLIMHAADIFTRSWLAMGFEDFCYALYEDTELVCELFKQNAIMELRMLDVLVETFGDKIGALLYSDDLAYTEGLLVSASVYRTYLWPHLEKVFNRAKQIYVPIIYHTDGRLWEIFDDLASLGVNGIQPLEPKSMDLAELKQRKGNQFCLMGSIDIDLLSRGNPAEVEKMVRERIEILGQKGGYTVGTSNTVPEYINLTNYKTMIETALKYGKYE
jgi:uroporphyrinogen decarboxylase